MAIEKKEFEFPDPDKDDKKTPEFEIEIEEEEKPAAKKADEEELELEVEDDTPPADRNRKASAPPEELTDEELKDHSAKVQQRLKHFSKGYHDERREKERAQRERDEAARIAQQLLEEVQTLKGTVGKNQTTMLDQAKNSANVDLEIARKQYKEAYESGDVDKVTDAQEKLTAAKIKVDKVNNIRLPPLQEPKPSVTKTPQAPAVDHKAAAWAKKNPWFHTDEEMTGFAFGLHNKLVSVEGIDPNSDEYYKKLDTRIRQVFPDRFESEETTPPPSRKATPVASASRSTAPKKIRLTQSQVSIAKRLGVSLEQYAKEMVATESARNK